MLNVVVPFQGCRSAIIFCGSGSSWVFVMRIRIQIHLNKKCNNLPYEDFSGVEKDKKVKNHGPDFQFFPQFFKPGSGSGSTPAHWMRIRIQEGRKMNAEPCGSRSTALPYTKLNFFAYKQNFAWYYQLYIRFKVSLMYTVCYCSY